MRDQSQGLVGLIVEKFNQTPKMWLAIAPEGTRSKVNQWRTGFYHIAHSAGVPIIPISLDWKNKKIKIFDSFQTTGDIEQDIPRLQGLY